MSDITSDKITCPVCGDSVFDPRFLPKKLYRCSHFLYPLELPNGRIARVVCSHCQAYCNKCEKLYDESEFGKHGDVWECKHCGTVQWGYTDFMREKEGLMGAAQRINSQRPFLNEIEKWANSK